LSGTLVRPAGVEKAPLLIVFHGALSPLRSEALYEHLKRMLPSLGIAVFTYDRRGTGRSGGSAKGNSFDLLADDGIAAAEILAKDPHVDAARIGFWGLSQGGWLSLLAASKYKPAAFAIAISAPMVTPDVQMNFAVENILRIKGISQADIDLAIAARTAVDRFERGQLDRATAQARLDQVIGKPWFDLIYMDKTFSDPDKSGWAKEIRHDPLTSIGAVSAPTLIIYGSADPWVPAAVSMDRLKNFTNEHPNFETVVVDGADHAMETDATLEQQIDPAYFPRQAPNSVEYFGRLSNWLHEHGIAK
jgi:dipeptidyl aminopeptidase/acylaminoacyl peptidase